MLLQFAAVSTQTLTDGLQNSTMREYTALWNSKQGADRTLTVSSIVLAVLLMTGETGQNPGPVVEVEDTVQLVCTECGRNVT